MTPQVLNPVLLDTAARHLRGRVEVANAGRQAEGYYLPDPRRHDKKRLVIVYWGESYVTDCEFCVDGRQRMSISHLYGTFDETSEEKGSFLWRCYNSDCQKKSENRRRLSDMLAPPSSWGLPGGMGFRQPKVQPVLFTGEGAELKEVMFPGDLFPIDSVPNHPAATYLTNRKFDLNELRTVWRVGVAGRMPPGQGWVEGRIVATVWQDGTMVGYQARVSREVTKAEAKFCPKYVTHFPKSRALYGLDEAENEDVLVAFEGVTDVWRYGRGALAAFGKGLSAPQILLLKRRGRGRPVIMGPDGNDPESLPKFVKAATDLAAAGYQGKIGILALPTGTDPAQFPRPTLRAAVAAAVETAWTPATITGYRPEIVQ